MASKRRGTGRARPKKGSSLLAAGLSRTIRWVVVPCLGIAVSLWFAATFASLHSAKSNETATNFVTITLPSRQHGETSHPTWKEAAAIVEKKRAQPTAKPVQAVAKASVAKQQPAAAHKAVVAAVDPFDKAIAEAGLSRDKLLAAFADAGMAVSVELDTPRIAALDAIDLAMPSAARFHREEEANSASETAAKAVASILDPTAPLALGPIGIAADLAYASIDTDGTDLLEVAIATMEINPPETEVAVALAEPAKPDPKPSEQPQVAPREDSQAPQSAERQPEQRQAVVQPSQRERGGSLIRSPRAEPDSRKPASSSDRQEALAFVRPDKPSTPFKNLFNDTPKAGNKVAIYDISAAVVHMPDGSKLEAHSGIGKMADNPRYVNVKMNGPTPPNTYRLSMREKRFHGVEAVRMTPIGDQTMHGRDGILAHSYLLRGGREESHGCVAFANYPRFLQAFKQGKVTHIIVVPSMSKLTKAHFAPIRGV